MDLIEKAQGVVNWGQGIAVVPNGAQGSAQTAIGSGSVGMFLAQ